MKSVLFVTPRVPYPPLKGDQTVSYHRLRCLGRDHRLTLLTFYERESELEGLAELKRHCRAIYPVKLPPWRARANMGLGLAGGEPLQVAYYRSAAFRDRLQDLLARERFDVVHGFLLRMAPYMQGLGVPTVLELIDSMQLNLRRRLAHERGPLAWALEEELRRVTAYERALAGRFDAMTVVSRLDREAVGARDLWTVPNGVDTDRFRPRSAPRPVPTVIFAGHMSYAPNVKAARWFVEACWERVRAAVPDARFVIAGASPAPAVRALAGQAGVEVTGYVASMPDALAGAHVAIAPMRSGSGMQNKILEAMAAGLPVVTTTLGRGDIRAPRSALAVADTPDAFASRVIALLEDAAACARMGEAGRAFVVANHSWTQAADRLRAIYAAIGAAPQAA